MKIVNKTLKIINKIKRYIKLFRLSEDIDYQNNSTNIKECFFNRVDDNCDDTKLLDRIVTSYKKASENILDYPEIFRPSNEWLPIYRNHFKDIIQALEECNIKEVDKLYKNFWRNSTSTGLIGGYSDEMNKQFFEDSDNISYKSKKKYLDDVIFRFKL